MKFHNPRNKLSLQYNEGNIRMTEVELHDHLLFN